MDAHARGESSLNYTKTIIVVVLFLLLFAYPATAGRQPTLVWTFIAEDALNDIAIPSDGTSIVVGSENGNIYFIDKDGQEIWRYNVGDSIQDVDISQEGGYITATSGRNVYFLDKSGALVWSNELRGKTKSTSVSSEGNYVAVSTDKTVYIFSKDGGLVWEREFAWGVEKMAMSSDGYYIVVSTFQKNFYLFNETKDRMWELKASELYANTFETIALSSDGTYMAIGANNGRVYTISKEKERLYSFMTDAWSLSHRDEIESMDISQDGRYIALGANAGSSLAEYDPYIAGNVYFLDNGRLSWKYKIDKWVTGAAMSSFGDFIAVTSDRNIYLFDNSMNVKPRAGSISISSEPGGAEVYLDDIYEGITPIEMSNIPVGPHVVKLVKSGYYNYSSSINVEGDKTTQLSAALNPVPTVTPTTLPPTTQPPTESPTTTPAPTPSPTTTAPATSPPSTTSVSEESGITKPVIYGIGIVIFLAFFGSTIKSIRRRRLHRKATKEIKSATAKVEAEPEKTLEPAISVMELSKSYKNDKILDGVTFQLEHGKLCAVVGPSGGGKSIIIESIAGRITPDEGEIKIEDMDVKDRKDKINKLVGFVPQHFELYMDQSVWQNMMNSALKWEVKDADAKSENVLKQLSIFERKDVAAKNLSGGQLKRLSLGMELIREPPILVLDEPTTGLDPTNRDQILSALSKIVFTEKKTVIFTTHFMDEAEHCDEVIIVGNAKVLAKGAPSELARRMPGMGKIVQVTLEEVGEELVSKVEGIEGVKKVIREGRVMKIIMDSPDSVEISQKIKDFGGTIEGSKIEKARMKEVFVYYTGVYPEE